MKRESAPPEQDFIATLPTPSRYPQNSDSPALRRHVMLELSLKPSPRSDADTLPTKSCLQANNSTKASTSAQYLHSAPRCRTLSCGEEWQYPEGQKLIPPLTPSAVAVPEEFVSSMRKGTRFSPPTAHKRLRGEPKGESLGTSMEHATKSDIIL